MLVLPAAAERAGGGTREPAGLGEWLTAHGTQVRQQHRIPACIASTFSGGLVATGHLYCNFTECMHVCKYSCDGAVLVYWRRGAF